ncbi:MAG TPA: hypothetical protein VMM13_05595, partial [Euzebya sp.]|nr:hypothetical protein [Euzebya sp.]
PSEGQCDTRPDDPAVTARILWRLAGGRTRLTGTSAARPACDATLIPSSWTSTTSRSPSVTPTARSPARTGALLPPPIRAASQLANSARL